MEQRCEACGAWIDTHMSLKECVSLLCSSILLIVLAVVRKAKIQENCRKAGVVKLDVNGRHCKRFVIGYIHETNSPID